MECIVLASRRGKNNHARRKQPAPIIQSIPEPSEQLHNDLRTVVTPNGNWKGYEASSTPTALSNAPNVPACVTFEDDSDNVGSDNRPAADDGLGETIRRVSSTHYEGPLTPETATNNPKQQQHSAEKLSLPAFIAPLSNRILSEDLEFLILKEALTVPEPELRLEILRSYMFSVHPFMPMLDYKAFLYAVLEDGKDSRISLLLFQAVMFAGLHSLPLHVVSRLGFESTKHARETFFTRVRLLYEFDVESDNVAILQSLVLMSSWYSKWDARRHTWHWTGLAYDLARRMGLHREPTRTYKSAGVQRFRRRLWWSLYIRDRMITLGVRSPLRIRDDDFDVAMLTIDDLDIEPFDDDMESGQDQPLIPNADERASTGLMCVQLAKLCVLIGKVVSSQYSTLSTLPGVPPTTMVVSRRDEEHIEALRRFDKELDDWLQTLPPNVRGFESTTANIPHSCSEIHWAMLNMAYLTTVNVLHRGQALQPMSGTAEVKAVQNSSKSKVKHAARSITKVSQNLLRNDQVRFLSLVGVTALIAACLSHMLDIRSGDEDVRDASTFRLYQSLEVLQSLRGIYGSADAAVSFLASVTRKAGISVPADIASPTASLFETDGRTRASISGRHVTPWKGLIASPNGMAEASGNQGDNPQTIWQGRPIQPFMQPPNDHQQQQIWANGEAQIPASSGLAQEPAGIRGLGNSALDPAASNDAAFASKNSDFADATFGGLSNSVVDGAFSDWNNGLIAGMDLEPLSFNYDFYSDTFGFFDDHLQGLS
jgi:hypothetical protein